jgi:hypothetical protein
MNSDSVIRFYPDKIYGYRFIDGKYFISKKIEFENKQSVVFLEYLIKGKLDVYLFQDKEGQNHYFVSTNVLPLMELKYSKEIIDIGGKNVLHESKQPVGVLNYYTSDCPDVKNEILKLDEPNHKKLINFAKKYHNLICKDEKCIIYEKKMPLKIKLNLVGGANTFFSNISPLKQGTYPSFGFNILFSQIRESLYLGIGYFSDGKIDNSLNVFRIPFSFNYIHPGQGLSPYLAYELSISNIGLPQALKLGMKYQIRKTSFLFALDLKTNYMVIPYGASLNFGIMYDFK